MTTNNRWIYLQDMASQAVICNLTTLKLQTIYATHVEGGAKIGLRGFILEAVGNGQFRETGEQQFPLDEEIFDLMLGNYKAHNSWNYDYPNWSVDQSFPAEQLAAVKARLVKDMSTSGMKFDCVLQPRSLLYFTDGNYESQQRFEALIPRPNGLPYLRDGSLRRRYRGTWSSQDRDQGVPFPKAYQSEVGNLTPVLYKGQALVCRFTLDDQVIAFEGCRVYLTPEGDFICSDWCQRHDFSSYQSGGINLQMGIYDFKSWVLGPCVSRATQQRVFKPSTGAIKVEQVRELLKRAPLVKVPTFEEAVTAAKAQLAKTSPVPVTEPGTELRPLVARIAALHPGADHEVIKQAIETEIDAQLVAQQVTDSNGTPILAAKTEIYSGAAQLEAVGGHWRLVLQPGTCGSGLPKGKVCVKDGNGKVHNHISFSAVLIDYAALTPILARLIDEVTYVPPMAVDVGPITADVLAEAKAKLAERAEDRLALERTQLLLDNVKKAQGLTVEVNPDLLPSVQPLVATYDSGYSGEAVVKRLTDDIVTVSWNSGPFADTPLKYAVRDNGAVLSTVKNPLKGNPEYAEAKAESPLAGVVNWYFDSFLPTQQQAQAQALAGAQSVHANGDSFRCYPVVGGATIVKVVGGAVSESVTVRQKANGHIYQILDTGKTALLENGSLKDAATKFLKGVAA